MDQSTNTSRLITKSLEFHNSKVLVVLYDKGSHLHMQVYVYTDVATNCKRLVREKSIDRNWKNRDTLELLSTEFPEGI